MNVSVPGGREITLEQQADGTYLCPEPGCLFKTISIALIKLHCASCASLGYHSEPGNFSQACGLVPANEVDEEAVLRFTQIVNSTKTTPSEQHSPEDKSFAGNLTKYKVQVDFEHKVFICTLCGNCLNPVLDAFTRHIARAHPALKSLLPFPSELSSWVQSLAFPTAIEKGKLPPWSPAVPGLSVLWGSYCNQCQTVLTTGSITVRHSGCPRESIMPNIPYQTWFRYNGATSSRCWPVQLDAASHVDSELQLIEGEPLNADEMSMALKIKQAAAGHQNRITSYTVQEWDQSPFITAMSWPSPIAKSTENLMLLVNLAQPSQSPTELCFTQAFMQFADNCIAECKVLFQTGSHQIKLLGSKDPENAKSWNWNLTTVTTRKRYLALWSRFMSFLLRIILARADSCNVSHDIAKSIVLPIQVETVFSKILTTLFPSGYHNYPEDLSENSLKGATRLFQQVHDALLYQNVFSDFYDSPIVHFVQAIGISPSTHTFLGPADMSQTLASIQWCMRLFFQSRFQNGLARIRNEFHDRGSAEYAQAMDVYRQQYQKSRQQAVVAGCPGPFGYISATLAASISHSRHSHPKLRLTYMKDGSGLIFDGQTYLYASIKEVVQQNIEELCAMMPELTGFGLHQLGLPAISSLKDDLENVSSDHYFALDERNNPKTLDRIPARCLAMLGKIFLAVDKDVMAESSYQPYLCKFKAFASRLACLLLMTCGMPPRGPELFSLNFKNTAMRRRQVFIVDGEMMLLFSYHKSQTVTGRPKNIARFPCAASSQLLLVYLLVLRPILGTLGHERAEMFPSQAVIENLDVAMSPQLFPSTNRRGEIFDTGRDVTPIMKNLSVLRGLPPMGVAAWRHIVKAIGRSCLNNNDLVRSVQDLAPELLEEDGSCDPESVPDTADMDMVREMQHGHSVKTGSRVYAVSMREVHELGPEVLQMYRDLSRSTNRFLGVDGKSATDYIDFGDESRPNSAMTVVESVTLDDDVALAITDLLQPPGTVPGEEQGWTTRSNDLKSAVNGTGSFPTHSIGDIPDSSPSVIASDPRIQVDTEQETIGDKALKRRASSAGLTQSTNVKQARISEQDQSVVPIETLSLPNSPPVPLSPLDNFHDELAKTPVLSGFTVETHQGGVFQPIQLSRQQTVTAMHPMVQTLLSALHRKPKGQFRYLSNGQRDAMSLMLSLSSGPSIDLIVLPTGGGKSDLYLLSALYLQHECIRKVIVLVVPFTALLAETKLKCQRAGIHTKSWIEVRDEPNLQPAILLVGAEHTHGSHFLHVCKTLLDQGHLHSVFFDECHTIYDGDYRPLLRDFTHLHELKVPIVLLSATVPVQRETELLNAFMHERTETGTNTCPHQLSCKHRILRYPTHRPSVEFIVLSHPPRMSILLFLKNILDRLCPSLAEQERILVYFNFKSTLRSYAALDPTGTLIYYRGLHGEQSEENLEIWRRGSHRDKRGQQHVEAAKVLLATSALGCGLDYPFIRHIFHVGEPNDLTTIAQESGRGSRRADTVSTHTVIYNGSTPGSYAHESFLTSSDAEEVLDYLKPDVSNGCRRSVLSRALDGRALSCFDLEGCEYCDLCSLQTGVKPATSILGTAILPSLWPDPIVERDRNSIARAQTMDETPEQASRFFDRPPVTPSSPSEYMGKRRNDVQSFDVTTSRSVSLASEKESGSESSVKSGSAYQRVTQFQRVLANNSPSPLNVVRRPTSILSAGKCAPMVRNSNLASVLTKLCPTAQHSASNSASEGGAFGRSPFKVPSISYADEEEWILGHPILGKAAKMSPSSKVVLDRLSGYCSPCVLLFSSLSHSRIASVHKMTANSHYPCGQAGLTVEHYSEFRRRLQFRPHSCCFSCRVPQKLCNQDEAKRFEFKNCTKANQELTLPAVWLFWKIGKATGWQGNTRVRELWEQLPEMHCTESDLLGLLACSVTVNREEVQVPYDKFRANILWLVFLALVQNLAESGGIDIPEILPV